MSVAGGYYKAAIAAEKAGCDCVQIFTKNNNRWAAKALTDDDCEKFKSTMSELNISHPLSHASYLINMASPDETLRQKSVDAFIVELQRAELLGISNVVVHPGSFTKSSEDEGIAAISKSLDEIHERIPDCTTRTLLENTAGQGTNLGHDFVQLKRMIEGIDAPSRVGVCIDTCHTFAAGYPLDTNEAYAETMEKLDEAIGIDQIFAIHLNDSKNPLGSRKDRHENIGEGEMGLEPFRNLLNDSRFAEVPMYLETPKGENDDGEDLDVVNLRVLRSLIG